jgi:hypothetical protein
MGIPVGLLLLVMSMAAPCTGSAQGTRPSFSVTISVPQDVVAAGSEVKVRIILKNTSNHDIVIPRSNAEDEGEFHNKITVRDEEGNLVADKATVSARTDKNKDTQSELTNLTMETVVSFTLKPGESLKDGIKLSEIYDLSKPGKYSIEVERIDESTKTVVKSNMIMLTVTP